MARRSLLVLCAVPVAHAQTWTTIPIGFFPGTMVLMTDGTVLVHYVTEVPDGTLYPSGVWMRLTPDAYGNYTDGTWSQLPTMPGTYAPEFHATAVLPDGRLVVEGGEYNGQQGQVETNLGAIYDPVSNTWTSINPPSGFADIGDADSVVLPNGTLMVGNCCTSESVLLNPNTLSWTVSGLNKQDSNSEENWVLLPNGKVLTVDLWASNGTTSELFDPQAGTWAPTGTIPVSLEYSQCHETGPMVLRPDGTVTAIGGNGQLATYDSSSGTWTAGPLIGGILGEDDGPAVLLPDGNVFFQVSESLPGDCYGTGSYFFEWDGSNLTEEPGPPDSPSGYPSYYGRMLVLPTGQVLYADAYDVGNKSQDKNLYLYTPSGTYQTAWQPTITGVAATLDQSSLNNDIYGTQFNGLSQGSMYGDDEQAAENFPLVYIKNIATGHVFYCRTHDFSTMAVATGSAQASAQFDVPGNVETGPSDLVVVVNGIPSAPVPVNIDFGQGQQSVTVSPTQLNMVSTAGSTAYGSSTLTNNGPGPLGISSVAVSGSTFSLSSTNCHGIVQQGDSCGATVEFAPGGVCLGQQLHGTLNFSDGAGQQTVTLTGTQRSCIEVPERGGDTMPKRSPPLPGKPSGVRAGGPQ